MSSVRSFLFIIILLSARSVTVSAQDSPPYKKMALTFNITRMIVNEINMGVEIFITQKKSIEFDGGVVYANEFMQNAAESFTNDAIFSEHGYAARFHYKFWQRKEGSKWRIYVAPGVVYKHLYYTDLPVTISKTDNQGKPYTETLKQDRTRDKGGLEFLWGNVFEANKFLALEIYYGAGISVTAAERTDYDRYATYERESDQYKNQTLPTYIDNTVYFRPVLNAGFKLVMRL